MWTIEWIVNTGGETKTTLQNKYNPTGTSADIRISDAITLKAAFQAMDGHSDESDHLHYLLKKPNQPVCVFIVFANRRQISLSIYLLMQTSLFSIILMGKLYWNFHLSPSLNRFQKTGLLSRATETPVLEIAW